MPHSCRIFRVALATLLSAAPPLSRAQNQAEEPLEQKDIRLGQRPKLIRAQPPEYPREMSRAGLIGGKTVVARVQIPVNFSIEEYPAQEISHHEFALRPIESRLAATQKYISLNDKVRPAYKATHLPAGPALPMAAPYENTAQCRWLEKRVHASRLLDDMEDLAGWSQRSTLGYATPAPLQGEMTLTPARFQDGRHAIRLRSKTTGERRGPQMGRPFGSARIVRRFAGENWSEYNSLSFWVYPDLPGFHSVSLAVVLQNDGAIKLPGPARLGVNHLALENHAWNHVVWEIPDLPRDKVTGVEFQYWLQGNEPGASDTVTFDFDRLELQRVDADYYEGWEVAPGRIAYCHTGYRADAEKTAIASGLDAAEFEVVDHDSGQVVASRKITTATTPLGAYQVLDFSEVRRAGTYLLRAGRQSTPPFRVDHDVWTSNLWKAINYFYCQRCGTAIPGIHGVCHQDWQGIHGDKTVIINGGWHDAGDLSQGLANTSEAIGAMFGLAEQLRLQGREPELAARLIEEGRWGLEWLLKNNFGGGFRVAWATHDFWTDGKVGNLDDVFAQAGNGPRENFMAAVAEAIASRVLRDTDRDLASRCLASAEADWEFAIGRIQGSGENPPLDFGNIGNSRPLETAAIGLLATVELLQATGKSRYERLAVKLGRSVVDCQQRDYLPGLDQPLAGFFFESDARKQIAHSDHRSQAHTPIVALAALCRALPDHADWIHWYSAVVFYSEYLKSIAAYTAPYGVLPASLYRDDEHLEFPEISTPGLPNPDGATRENFREQVRNGVSLGGGYWLRRFPVWFKRRGHFGILLPQTKALSTAARLRGDAKLLELAERQLQWLLGRNPFAQSTMYGEGHDYMPHYSAMSGQIVGSLPVGIETLMNHDAPYWPTQNHVNPKETWVFPVTLWLAVVQDLVGARSPAGKIVATHTAAGPHVRVEATLQGEGVHDLEIRGANIRFAQPKRRIELADKLPHRVVWQGTIESVAAPWVAVIVPAGDGFEPVEIAPLAEPPRLPPPPDTRPTP